MMMMMIDNTMMNKKKKKTDDRRRGREEKENNEKREQMFNNLVTKLYEKGKAIEAAAHLEIDAVIDPADTRRTILRAVKIL